MIFSEPLELNNIREHVAAIVQEQQTLQTAGFNPDRYREGVLKIGKFTLSAPFGTTDITIETVSRGSPVVLFW